MTTDNRASSFHVSPEILMPIPKIKESARRVKRKGGKTAILTDSPFKRELEAKKRKITLLKQKERG